MCESFLLGFLLKQIQKRLQIFGFIGNVDLLSFCCICDSENGTTVMLTLTIKNSVLL